MRTLSLLKISLALIIKRRTCAPTKEKIFFTTFYVVLMKLSKNSKVSCYKILRKLFFDESLEDLLEILSNLLIQIRGMFLPPK